MASSGSRKKRREGGRIDLRQRRAERRVKRRMAAAEGQAEPRITLLQRAGWTMRETAWSAQEKLLWPLGDWTLVAIDAARWPFERAAWALREKLIWPLQDRLATTPAGGSGMPKRAKLAVLGAVAVGALSTGAIVAANDGGPSDGPDREPVIAAASTPEPDPLIPVADTEDEEVTKGPELKGVLPSFGAKSPEERRKARRALRKLKTQNAEPEAEGQTPARSDGSSDEADSENTADDSPTADDDATTRGKEEPAAGGDTETASGATASNAELKKARRKESALSVAERFAMAFVSYEVGAAGGPTKKTFRDTADKDLFDSLTERPPRQPAGKKVPKARVVNVVGGPRKEKSMEVSIGLLRVDGLSELRLDMQRLGRGWVVKTVRG